MATAQHDKTNPIQAACSTTQLRCAFSLAMAGRTTSAAYRMPTSTSDYHQKCIEASVKALQANAPPAGENYPGSAYRNCDKVSQEKIWTENVQKEHQATKTWEQNWGFMTEYDFKGNRRPKRVLPSKTTVYSSIVPVTSSRQYGSRLDSASSHSIHQIELSTSHRKKRSGLEANYC